MTANKTTKKKRFRVIVSHPVQYHAILWRELSKVEQIKLDVLFCSSHGQNESLDKGFGVKFKWDIPLTRGYNYQFFKNSGFGNGFTKYINWSLIKDLMFKKADYVYFHGVNNFTSYVCFWISKLKGSTTIIRNIAHLRGESHNSKLKAWLRDVIFGSAYRKSSYCLYIGTLNADFFKSFGVKDHQLIHAPHIVDNDYFKGNQIDDKSKFELKQSLGISPDSIVVLFCGKFISVKQPFLLFDAFKNAVINKKVTLLMVGDGQLRSKLEQEAISIVEHNPIKNIKFLGFKNQSELPSIYSISDLLVLPSLRETWGLVVNEALNFSMATIVSDQVGCGPDLVSNKTGIIFSHQKVNKLTNALEEVINNSEKLEEYKQNALPTIKNWGVKEFVSGINKILNE